MVASASGESASMVRINGLSRRCSGTSARVTGAASLGKIEHIGEAGRAVRAQHQLFENATPDLFET